MIRRVLHWPLSRRSMSTPSSNNSQLLSSLSETAAVKPLKKPERKKSAIRRAGGPVPVQPAIAATSLDLASASSCFAYCTARHYQLESLSIAVQQKFSVRALLRDDYVHVQWDDKRRNKKDSPIEAFFFKEGSMVTWNSDRAHDRMLLETIRGAEQHPFVADLQDEEHMTYYSDTHRYNCRILTLHRETGIVGEDIVFGKLDSNESFYAKLAFSHGIARSTQLGCLENHLDHYLKSIECIPDYMMRGKEPPFTAQDVMCKHGQLLHLRGLLNLHSDLVDSSPDLYWSRGDLAKYFESVSRTLDIIPRIRILNQRLDHANRVIDLMKDRLTEKHGTRLELIIIALIAVEVGFEMVHYLNELNYIDLYGLLGNKSVPPKLS